MHLKSQVGKINANYSGKHINTEIGDGNSNTLIL